MPRIQQRSPASSGSKSLWQDLNVALVARCQVKAFATLAGSHSLFPPPQPRHRSLFILAHHDTDTSYLFEPTMNPPGTCSLSFWGVTDDGSQLPLQSQQMRIPLAAQGKQDILEPWLGVAQVWKQPITLLISLSNQLCDVLEICLMEIVP